MLQINLPIFSANSQESTTKDIDYLLHKAGTVGGYVGTCEDITFKMRWSSSETLTIELSNGFTVLSNKIAARTAYKVLPIMVKSFLVIIASEN